MYTTLGATMRDSLPPAKALGNKYYYYFIVHTPLIECTNSFVTVNVDSATSTLTCQFQNTQNTNQKTCSVEYRVCGQEQALTAIVTNTSESTNRVTLQLSLPNNGVNCYTYTVTASDGISTAMVEGRSDQPGKHVHMSWVCL